ncbi:iron ABC transporter permease [Nocardioides sp.]|uniref:FecCD family ABC transporter permease n=1 Tax=Nocardioides sp. TaxID=35761 RepID=UPI0026245DA6|nr:iron ABC transporter permease [Nocardioides sp.]
MVERRSRRSLLLGLVIVLLLAGVAASLLVGSRGLAPDRVWELLWHPDGSLESAVVRGQRLPRTVLGLVVGAALGLAGAVMQALTRNPLADPGILGVNAGAALVVVAFVAVSGVTDIGAYVWFALAGAGAAAATVYAVAGVGRPDSSPVRLALAGVAVSAALASLTSAVVLADQEAFNEFRFWVAGSLQGRGWSELGAVAPFLGVGLVLALSITGALGVLMLGEDTARGLGVKVSRVRTLALLAVTALCGAATAAVGPIAFVGLAVPMVARALMGHDLRWISACSLALGALWLLTADVLARVLAPEEVAAGIVAALVGGPVFVLVARRRRVPAL